jgi:DnaJ family protein C protein 28
MEGSHLTNALSGSFRATSRRIQPRRSLTRSVPGPLSLTSPTRHCILASRSGNLRYSSKHDHRASSQLWDDAAREDEEESVSSMKPPTPQDQHPNWTGEESIKDAVLRMLVDKYKPLRGGIIRSAEEKLRDSSPPVISSSLTSPNPTDWAKKPLLPAVEGHKPWHTTYKVPSAPTSVKTGRLASFAPDSSSRKPSDEHGRKPQIEQRKRELKIERLTKAVESTLDYKLGIKDVGSRRVNPVSLKGWNSLVEEKIEELFYLLQFFFCHT